MKTSHLISVATAVLFLVGSDAASAQGGSGVKQACMADVQRMCPNATPGHGWIMQCLKGRMTEVTPVCKSALDSARAARAARKAAGAGPGGGGNGAMAPPPEAQSPPPAGPAPQ